MHKAKSIFLLFITAILFLSWMQVDICPEKPIIVNGHQVHGLCALRAKSKGTNIWPVMTCKTLPYLHSKFQSSEESHRISPDLVKLIFAVYIFHLQINTTNNTTLPRYFFHHTPAPPLDSNALRGPPVLV
ncbi:MULTISPECIES: hypothetical protein [unclassified Mucilaginibacter]|uniref:hypothetical protein n=1 Tax=unclassified Mucilaginibacter TaxID=2617802 RepID=UPI002AC97BC0|nr:MULTISPECIES: hypothetical protein [unclassified Mucilaginibacter]MEB0262797.1 hypothetical protein [Mucilaginibacter sp. 10I4]MEB0278180.1 hypothetical protein [Mucilaginibacter sp. 10B2]MEB0302062.1 hypothetical protein [Mucilaginibacter sp. 5C4]WPX23826.1 hypothetical protein RHM67_00845 [Mucilaginibacter sp. 5C4]